MTFVPITAYRNFYDVPRVFILDWQGGSYFFDCRFDDAIDDYAHSYLVFRIGTIIDVAMLPADWNDLRVQFDRSATIPVNRVKFDSTRRAAIDDSVFEIIDWS